ncbi:MAG: hypothetical protein OHK0029_07350 [Armatimonadaceae bacterium]
MANRTYHRYEGELLAVSPQQQAVIDRSRVAMALGPEPLPDAQHLLPPIAVPTPPPTPAPGPYPFAEFVVDFAGRYPLPLEEVRDGFAPEKRAGLGFGTLWMQAKRSGAPVWERLNAYEGEEKVQALALAWELSGILTTGTDAVQELAGYVLRASERGAPLGLQAVPREEPAEAARRAATLITLRHKYGYSVEMRLMPQGRTFPARAVWRIAYSLGFAWGDMDLFHFTDSDTGRRLFSLSTVGHPGYFLPERAAEGEGVQGLALGFELPHNPAPLDCYDRMALALAHFRKELGGRPVTPEGAELDADRLWDDRDRLEEAVQEMSRAGVAPGSPEADRVF